MSEISFAYMTQGLQIKEKATFLGLKTSVLELDPQQLVWSILLPSLVWV
jgi:hypothetical protein